MLSSSSSFCYGKINFNLKKPSSRQGILPLDLLIRESYKTLEKYRLLAFLFHFLPIFDRKSLLLMILHTLVELREIELLLTWKPPTLNVYYSVGRLYANFWEKYCQQFYPFVTTANYNKIARYLRWHNSGTFVSGQSTSVWLVLKSSHYQKAHAWCCKSS